VYDGRLSNEACCVAVRQGRVMYPDGIVGEVKISHGEMLVPILRA
jgi:hypothetical protein